MCTPTKVIEISERKFLVGYKKQGGQIFLKPKKAVDIETGEKKWLNLEQQKQAKSQIRGQL